MGTRKANIIYRLRRKGYHVVTRERMIYIPYPGQPFYSGYPVGIRRLHCEFGFSVQISIF